MRKLLGIMYPSQHAVFNSLNEMIEILIVAAFYDISWIVKSVEKAMLDLLPESENGDHVQKVAQATRCRDILLVLQENVQFSDENPNPNYKPFDTAFASITATLLAKLAAFANEGLYIFVNSMRKFYIFRSDSGAIGSRQHNKSRCITIRG